MLKDNLFTLIAIKELEPESYKTEVQLNPAHAIFAGHFPTQPVLPGVCLLEMVKEIVGTLKNRPLSLKSAASIKYLQVVDPQQNPRLSFDIQIKEEEPGLVKVNANSFLQNGAVNFKLKGVFG